MKRTALAAALVLLPLTAPAEEVGRVGVDWTGNDIILEAVQDPKVKGVTCHIAYFDRSLLDRLSQGNWFEDPSNASIACRQTGPIKYLDELEAGEEVFKERISLIWKSIQVVRFYDEKRNTLIYLTYSDKLVDGSPKNAISAVVVGPWGTEPAPAAPVYRD